MISKILTLVLVICCWPVQAGETHQDFPVYQTRYASSLESSQRPITTQRSININTADITLLTQLKGVGTKKAEAIVEWRKKYGPFKSVDDLVQVKGIGQVILESNRAKLTIAN